MEPQPSPAKIALKWGSITGISLILYTTFLYVTDLATTPGLSLLIYGILATGLVMAMRELRAANGGYLRYGEGLGIGALTSAVSGLISTTYSIIYNTFVDPAMQQRMMDKVREQYEEQGKLSDEQIDQAMSIAQKFQSPGLLFVAGVFGTILAGVILSLVIAAVLRRNRPDPF